MGEDGRERSMRDPPILHPSLQPSQPSVGANDGGSGVGGGNGGGGGGGGRHGGATCKSAWRRDALPNAPLPLSFPAGWTRALRGRDSLVYPLSRHTHHGQNQTIDRQTGVPTLTPRGTRGRYFVPPVYQLASYSPQSVSVFPFLSPPPPLPPSPHLSCNPFSHISWRIRERRVLQFHTHSRFCYRDISSNISSIRAGVAWHLGITWKISIVHFSVDFFF